MTSFNDLVSPGAANAWLFIPSAIVLGALHGLEPGHSKTMMAAFIIAIRGTIFQAVLLGLSAAFSHSLVIWALAAVALRYGSQWNAETTEPYFQLVSGALIIGMAVWMFWRTRREQGAAAAHDHPDEGPQGGKLVDTGHGLVEITVFETNVPPRFRLYFYDSARKPKPLPQPKEIAMETVRLDGARQSFSFFAGAGFLEAMAELPEPHEFDGTLTISHGDHAHTFDFKFSEADHHHHHGEMDLAGGEYQDAHERAHAGDIRRRFASRTVSTGQIVIFGLTGGLMPCPAALTVLLVCLQLRKFALGFTLVVCFSFGLALTMVTTGALAAWGVRHASKRFKGFGDFARKAPCVSGVLPIAMGLFFAIQGWRHLP
ncbi:MAG: nickel/cobalt efflux transporter RcnA [Undibacterium sp.]|nr:nickel/cobalt efflux transporter RcnA [Opitutaceae bacterium]